MQPSPNPFGFGGSQPRPNRKSKRAERKISGRRGYGSAAGGGPSADDVVSLSPQGRELFNHVLEAASIEAGRSITGEDLLEVLRRVRVETGVHDIELSEPSTVECFRKHLRQIGQEPPLAPSQPKPIIEEPTESPPPDSPPNAM